MKAVIICSDEEALYLQKAFKKLDILLNSFVKNRCVLNYRDTNLGHLCYTPQDSFKPS